MWDTVDNLRVWRSTKSGDGFNRRSIENSALNLYRLNAEIAEFVPIFAKNMS